MRAARAVRNWSRARTGRPAGAIPISRADRRRACSLQPRRARPARGV